MGRGRVRVRMKVGKELELGRIGVGLELGLGRIGVGIWVGESWGLD